MGRTLEGSVTTTPHSRTSINRVFIHFFFFAEKMAAQFFNNEEKCESSTYPWTAGRVNDATADLESRGKRESETECSEAEKTCLVDIFWSKHRS